MGKTRLAEELRRGLGAPWCSWGRASHGAAAPYGPVVAALRSLPARAPGRPRRLRPAAPPPGADPPRAGRRRRRRATGRRSSRRCAAPSRTSPASARRCSCSTTCSGPTTPPSSCSRRSPSRSASCRCSWSPRYRSDGLPRDHPLRRLRHELRRGGRLDELALAPLAPRRDRRARRRGSSADAPAPSLAAAIHDRTQGVPFFVEELAPGCWPRRADAGPDGLELAGDGEVPVPDTVRDAVLMRRLRALAGGPRRRPRPPPSRATPSTWSWSRRSAGRDGARRAGRAGLVREDGAGPARFRHALTREALYADVPWLRRRALHRRLAEAARGRRRAAARGRHPLAGRPRRGPRPRGAAAGGRRVPRRPRPPRRRPGRAPGARAVAGGRGRRRGASPRSSRTRAAPSSPASWPRRRGPGARSARLRADAAPAEQLAAAQRRLAAVHDLRGDREAAPAARRAAAATLRRRRAGPPTPRSSASRSANHLRAAAAYTPAIELARAAGAEAERAERDDLRARALGLEGVALAKRGDFEAGLEAVRAGLALALEHDLTPVAAELYQRLSLVLYDARRLPPAPRRRSTPRSSCAAPADAARRRSWRCVTCMVYVLRECGEWPRAADDRPRPDRRAAGRLGGRGR